MMVVETINRFETAEEGTYKYEYRMVKDKISLSSGEDNIEVQSYGIEIERQDLVGECVVNIEREILKHISPQRHKVHTLLKLAHEERISPLHLVDIFGEYADCYIDDFDKVLKEIAVN